MTRLASFLSATATVATFAAAVLAVPGVAHAGGVDVGVSVQISQPGVYGRIDIGRFPQPAVVLAQPVIIAAPPPVPGVILAPAQPVYMWVPPGHQKNWRKHCARYNACGVPVYFVRDEWYAGHVQPRERWEDHGRHGRGGDRERDRGRDQDGDRGERGHGRGHGRD